MPELPEVETVRTGLEPVLRGRRFVRVEQRRKNLRFPLPEHFAERLTGRKVLRLDRRAKYILVHLDDGEVLAIHLGMTGRFSVRHRGRMAQLGDYTYEHGHDARHDHVVFAMSGGAVVTYNDARRFGYMTLIRGADIAQDAFFRGLGVEPLSEALNANFLAGKARGRKTDLKAFLMDQRIVAGLGNIYVCEALFRTRLNPARAAACLATPTGKPNARTGALIPHIQAILAEAIEAGGSTLRDYQQADGSMGYFQHRFHVYGREGEPCVTPACRGKVRRSVQAGRSSFFCPVCQR